jgi:hypothetical protein
MAYSDADIDKIAEEAIADSKRTEERRREMKSGQVIPTMWGDIKVKLIIDLPANIPEDSFKKQMEQYGNVLAEVFRS